MSTKDESAPGANTGSPEAPVDLSEARSARAFAALLEGRDASADPAALEAVAVAARIAAGRRCELSAESKERVAAELFGAEAARPSRSRRLAPALALAAGLLVAAGTSILMTGWWAAWRAPAQSDPLSPHAAQLRDQAGALVASLLPPGGTPLGRAEAIAAELRAQRRQRQERAP